MNPQIICVSGRDVIIHTQPETAWERWDAEKTTYSKNYLHIFKIQKDKVSQIGVFDQKHSSDKERFLKTAALPQRIQELERTIQTAQKELAEAKRLLQE